MASVVIAGFCIIGSFATTIIIAQCMMPNNVGMASGLTIGFSEHIQYSREAGNYL